MTLSSKSPVRNPRCPPSTLIVEPLPDTLLTKISTWIFQGIFYRVKQHQPWHQGRVCPPVFSQEPSTSSNVFLKVKQYHPWHQGWPVLQVTSQEPSLSSNTHCPETTPTATLCWLWRILKVFFRYWGAEKAHSQLSQPYLPHSQLLPHPHTTKSIITTPHLPQWSITPWANHSLCQVCFLKCIILNIF